MGGFVVFSLCVVILLEILSYISRRPENGGGLVFASDVNHLSALSTFRYDASNHVILRPR